MLHPPTSSHDSLGRIRKWMGDRKTHSQNSLPYCVADETQIQSTIEQSTDVKKATPSINMLNTYTFNWLIRTTHIYMALYQCFVWYTVKTLLFSTSRNVLLRFRQRWIRPGLTDLWRLGGNHINPIEHRNSTQNGLGGITSTCARLWPQMNKTFIIRTHWG